MDNRGGAREQPVVRRVADGEKVVRKCLRIDAAPAGMEQRASAGHRLNQRIQKPRVVEAGHAAEADVNRGFSGGEEVRQRRRRHPGGARRQPLSAEVHVGRPVGRRGQQVGRDAINHREPRPYRLARRQFEHRTRRVGLVAECFPQHGVHEAVAGAIEQARHPLGRQKRRRERGGRRNRDHPRADSLGAQVFGRGKPGKPGQPRRQDRIAAFPCLDDGAQPGLGILVGDLRQCACGLVEAAALGDYPGDGMVSTESAANIAGERDSRHAERLGAAERGGIGEQSRLVSGIHQATAQRGERARIALGTIRRDDELHEPFFLALGGLGRCLERCRGGNRRAMQEQFHGRGEFLAQFQARIGEPAQHGAEVEQIATA